MTISDARGSWLLGAWFAWWSAAAFVTRDWTFLVPAACGLYGLVDVTALNKRLKR